MKLTQPSAVLLRCRLGNHTGDWCSLRSPPPIYHRYFLLPHRWTRPGPGYPSWGRNWERCEERFGVLGLYVSFPWQRDNTERTTDGHIASDDTRCCRKLIPLMLFMRLRMIQVVVLASFFCRTEHEHEKWVFACVGRYFAFYFLRSAMDEWSTIGLSSLPLIKRELVHYKTAATTGLNRFHK